MEPDQKQPDQGAAAVGQQRRGYLAQLLDSARRYRQRDRTLALPSAPREPDQGWRAVVDALADAAVVTDVDGIVRHRNGLIADFFPKLRVGQPISQVIRSPELLDAVDRAAQLAAPVTVELEDRVPVERRVAARVSVLRLETGADSTMLLVTFRDLTEQDRLAQMRTDFVANASHELRTPLASLRGFVETLQGAAREDAAARERFLGLMAAQAERMTRLIDDLLSLSRVEMRAHVPPRDSVDLNEVVQFVSQTMAPLARASGIAIDTKLLDAPASVRGDRDELVQVFQNLLQNAIKYGRKDGKTGIRITRESRRLSVAVSDDGPGIAPVHLPRLTERFYRVDVAASREKGGTGLGLAIVKHILNRHRGELTIASRLGVGSTFTVVLPELSRSPAET